MIDDIKTCQNCNLCANQRPLLDNVKKADIMVVGLSAKIIHDATEIPLDTRTRSGQLVSALEEIAQGDGLSFYRTNLVKCVPLDDNGKLRYPTKEEINKCFENIILEINYINPKLIILFGSIVENAFENHLQMHFHKSGTKQYKIRQKEKKYFISMYHPSYVLRSKLRKERFLADYSYLIRFFVQGEWKN